MRSTADMGRVGELIVSALVRFGVLPKPGSSLAAAIPGRFCFSVCFLKNVIWTGRCLSVTSGMLASAELRSACAPACLSLSFHLSPLPLPPRPCGFCHLFTGEWPLHCRDLNVSRLSLSLCACRPLLHKLHPLLPKRASAKCFLLLV